jgi:translation initiation factor 2B subunit (eIF-2B alpha/beta/delta family)
MQLKDILRNEEHGAEELLEMSLKWLERHPDALLSDVMGPDVMRILRETRPAMAAFGVLADRIDTFFCGNPDADTDAIVSAMRRQMRRDQRDLVRGLQDRLASRAPISLVTLSWSSSVLRALEQARDSLARVLVMESQPGGEGMRMAEALDQQHIPVQCFEDSALEQAVSKADAGVLGADTVLADGAIVNKVLSRQMAEALRAQDKDVWVLATPWKHSKQDSESFRLSGPEAELFEVVPGDLISAVIP